jgi:hypothetical protein
MTRFITRTRPAGLNAQRGFTLVSTVVSTLISSIMIAGVWSAYTDLKIQWRVSNAERAMDQYAASAMQDLTNTLSWAWGAKMIQGGPDNPRWKFYLDDIIEEHGLMSVSRWDQTYHIGPDRMLELTYSKTSGILFNGIRPKWTGERSTHEYLWTGRGGAPLGVLRSMDRRDRMTVESLLIDFNRFDYLPYTTGIVNEKLKRSQVVKIELTMHYTYTTPALFGLFARMYGNDYVRERKYTTQVSMRNWDVENNAFRDEVLGLSSGNG